MAGEGLSPVDFTPKKCLLDPAFGDPIFLYNEYAGSMVNTRGEIVPWPPLKKTVTRYDRPVLRAQMGPHDGKCIA